MKKMNILRGIALLLAAIMIFTSVPETALTAYAIEEEAELPAAEGTAVEQTGTGEETQATTPEVVEPETTDDVVIDPVASDAPEATGEEVANESAATRRVLNATQNGNLSGLAYGATVTGVTFSVTTTSPNAAYTDYEYYFAKVADGYTYNEGDDISVKLGYLSEAALPGHLTSTNVGSDGSVLSIITVSGVADQYYDYSVAANRYYLVIVDKDTNAEVSAATKIVPVTVGIGRAPVSANSTAAKNFNPDGAVVMEGYTVGPKENATDGVSNVVPQNVVLTSTLAETLAIPANDIKVAFTKTDTSDVTEALANPSVDEYEYSLSGTSLYTGKDITIAVSPKTGLKSEAATTAYDRYMLIYSASEAFNPINIDLTFTVSVKLGVDSVVQDGKDLDDELTADPAFVFTGEVGKTMNDIVVTPIGDNIAGIEVTLANGSASTTTLTTFGLTADFKNGTLVIGGTPTRSGDATLYVKVLNSTGTASAVKTIPITIEKTVLPYTVNGKTGAKTGDTLAWAVAGQYYWADDPNTTASNDAIWTNASQKTITIKNDRDADADLVLVYAWTTGSNFIVENVANTGTTPVAAGDDIKIKKGETVYLNIKPKADNGTTALDLTDTITFSEKTDDEVTAIPVTLNFHRLEGNYGLTKPFAAADGSSTDKLDNAEVNVAYEYQPEITTNDVYAAYTKKWSFAENGKGANGTALEDGVSAKTLLDDYGLSMNESTGLISGTPKKSAPNGSELDIIIRCDLVNPADATDKITRYVETTLEIAKAKKTVLSIMNGTEVVKKDIALGTVTDAAAAGAITKVLGIQSNADVDLAKVVAGIIDAKRDTSNNVSGSFAISGDYSTETTLKAGATGQFTLASTDVLDAGDYVIRVGVKGEDVTVGADPAYSVIATIRFTVAATPKLTYNLNAGGTGTTETLAVGTAYSHDTATKPTRRYITVDNAAERSMTYSWVAAYNGTKLSSIPAGMSIDETTGQIYGTPTKAGTYYVTISGRDAKTNLTGTVDLTININGTASIASLTTTIGTSDVSIIGNEYVFNGTYADEDPAQEITLTVKSGNTAITGAVNISISELNTATGQYTVSSNHFKVTSPSSGKLNNLTSAGKTFTIAPQKTAVLGDHAAKVTLSGDNFTDVSFYLFHAVVGELTIANFYDNTNKAYTTSYEGTVGKTFSQTVNGTKNVTTVPIAVITGQGDDQDVTVSQVLDKNTTTNIPAGMNPLGDDLATYGVSKWKWVKTISGTPSKAGEYNLVLKASVAKVATKTSQGTRIINSGYEVYPAQETSENATITFNINKAEGLMVRALAYDGKTSALGDSITDDGNYLNGGTDYNEFEPEDRTDDTYPDDVLTYDKNLDASFDRNGKISAYKGYIFKQMAPGYKIPDAGNDIKPLTITVRNTVNASVAATIKHSDTTNFTLNKTSMSIDASTAVFNDDYTVTGTERTNTFTVTPKSGLKAGEYTDTITISSPVTEDITFTVSFTVAEAVHSVTATYSDMLNLELDDNGVTPVPKEVTLVEKANNKAKSSETLGIYAKAASTYVDDSSAAAYEADSTPNKIKLSKAQAELVVENTGNQTMDITVREVADAAGTEFAQGSTKQVLNISGTKGAAGNKTGVKQSAVTAAGKAKFYLSAATLTTAGTKDTFIKVEFTTGTKTTDVDFVVIPVTYVMFADKVATGTVTQNSDTYDINPAGGYYGLDDREILDPNETYYTKVDGVYTPIATAAITGEALTVADDAALREAISDCRENEGIWSQADTGIGEFTHVTDGQGATKAASTNYFKVIRDPETTYYGEWYSFDFFADENVASTDSLSFTLTNPVVQDAKVTDSIYHMGAYIDGADIDAFTVTASPSDMSDVGLAGNYAVAAGSRVTFTVTPKAGLAAGYYEAQLVITGDNMKMLAYDLFYDISRTEASSKAITIPVYTKAEMTDPELLKLDQSVAERLYNTFAIALGNTATIVSDAGSVADHKRTVRLANGVTFEFTLNADNEPDGASADTWVKSAIVYKAGNVSLDTPAKRVIDTSTIEVATNMLDPNNEADYRVLCYTESVTFVPYSWVKFAGPSAEAFTAKHSEIVGTSTNIVTNRTGEAKPDDAAVTIVYALVPQGNPISSVLSPIPAITSEGKTFDSWYLSGTETKVNVSTTVASDMNVVAKFDSHTFPAAINNKTLAEQAEKGIVWNWNADNNGATVTLTLTSTDEDKVDFTLTGTYGTTQGDITVERVAQPASCTVGEGYLYTATVQYPTGGQTYTNTKLTGDPEGRLGHKWSYGNVDIVGNYDANGYYVATRKDGELQIDAKIECQNDGCDETPEVKYTTEGHVETAATCTANGYYLNKVTFYQLDADGVQTSKVAATRTAYDVIPATGHSFKTLNVDWKYDADGNITGIASAYVICDNCGERSEVTAEFTKYSEATGYALAKATIDGQALEAKGYPVADADLTLADPVWSWNADKSVATLTLTRFQDKKELDKKTYSATSTPAVTITRTDGALYMVYTAKVTIADKANPDGYTWTDTVKVEKTGVSVNEDGEEDGVIEFGFADNFNWTGEEDFHMVYTGAALKPTVVGVNGSKVLIEGVDYTVSYKNNTNAGAENGAQVIVKGKGNYNASTVLYFTIDKKNISDDDVYVGNTGGVAGKKITPVITYAGKILGKKDTNAKTVFKAALAANEESRTISADAVGAKNFTGEREIDLTVVANKSQLIPIKVSTFSLKSTPYTGGAITLNSDSTDPKCNLVVIGKTDGKTLVENEDYTVSYTNNVNAGKVTVQITGEGLYTGKVKKTFTITPAKTNTIVCENAEGLSGAYKNTGAVPSESLQIFDRTYGEGLINGKDYKVSYKNNKKLGQAKAIVTFIGNYKGAGTKGKLEVPFTVTPAEFNEDGNIEGTTIQSQVVYNAKKTTAKTYLLKPFVMIDGVLLKAKEYTVAYYQGTTLLDSKTVITAPTAEAPTTITAVITPKSTNYTVGDRNPITLTYDVVAPQGIDLTKAKVSIAKKAKTIGYTGEAITFGADDPNAQGTIVLKSGKTELGRGAALEEDFEITYVNNVKKGTATVILTPKDATKYSGSVKGTFKITAGAINWLKK